MPWCLAKGRFYMVYGRKDAHPPNGERDPLDDFGLTGATGQGRGLVLVLDLEDGEVDRADDPEKHISGSIAGSKIAIIGDLPTIGQTSITVSIPDNDTERQDGLNALFGNGASQTPIPIPGLFEAIASLKKSSSPPDGSAISITPDSSKPNGMKIVISGH